MFDAKIFCYSIQFLSLALTNIIMNKIKAFQFDKGWGIRLCAH